MKKLITRYLVMQTVEHGDSAHLIQHPMSDSSWSRSAVFDECGYDTQEEACTAILERGEMYLDYIVITSVKVTKEYYDY
jgi:hypothetical protein